MIARMLTLVKWWLQVVEGDAEPVAAGDLGSDAVVAAAQVLHKCVTGGEGPR